VKQIEILQPVEMTITNVNVRSEKHGKDRVPAIDVSLRLTASNMLLDQLKPELRQRFYGAVERPEDEPRQAALDGVEQLTETPLLLVEGLDPIHLQDELTGYLVTFDLGLGLPGSVVDLAGAKLCDFVVDMMQGGSIKLSFKAKASHVGKREIGELGVLIDSQISVRLEPPRAQQEQLVA